MLAVIFIFGRKSPKSVVIKMMTWPRLEPTTFGLTGFVKSYKCDKRLVVIWVKMFKKPMELVSQSFTVSILPNHISKASPTKSV